MRRQRPTWFYRVKGSEKIYNLDTGIYDTTDVYFPIIAQNKEEAYNKARSKFGNNRTFIFNESERISKYEYKRLKQNIPEG